MKYSSAGCPGAGQAWGGPLSHFLVPNEQTPLAHEEELGLIQLLFLLLFFFFVV